MPATRRAILATSAAGLAVVAGSVSLTRTAPTVMITGADNVAGLRFVRDYAARQWNVIAAAHNLDTAHELRALARVNATIRVERLDVTDDAAIQALTGKYAHQPIDVLISAAGFSEMPNDGSAPKPGSLDRHAPDDYLRLHAAGPLKVMQAFYGNILRGTHKQIFAVTAPARGYGRTLSDGAFQTAMADLAIDARKDGVKVVVLKA